MQVLGAEHVAQCGLGEQAGRVVGVLHVGHADGGVADPVVDDGVHRDGDAVLGQHLPDRSGHRSGHRSDQVIGQIRDGAAGREGQLRQGIKGHSVENKVKKEERSNRTGGGRAGHISRQIGSGRVGVGPDRGQVRSGAVSGGGAPVDTGGDGWVTQASIQLAG